MARDPEVSQPIGLEEIHEVLGEIEEQMAKSRPSWGAVTALSLYALALSVGRLLEIRESIR